MGRSLSGMGLGCGGGEWCACDLVERNVASCEIRQGSKADHCVRYRGLTPDISLTFRCAGLRETGQSRVGSIQPLIGLRRHREMSS